MTPPPGVASVCAYVRACARVCVRDQVDTGWSSAPPVWESPAKVGVRLTISPRCFVSEAQTALLISTSRHDFLQYWSHRARVVDLGRQGHGEIRRDPPPVPGAEHRPYGLHLFQHLKRRGPLPLEKPEAPAGVCSSRIHVTLCLKSFFTLFSLSEQARA